MKHLIMGTAGHIDHGKTSLIRALSGQDCDTHPEEKQKGITIHLGFSHLKINDELDIGIIDVPGHKNFINTMIAGANGIDFVLLIIAADSGIMPQTREHLQVMQMLKVNKGIIVINKIDLADDELLEILELELVEFTENTFLDNSPIVKVSAKDGTGIDELKDEIAKLSEGIQEKSKQGIYRQYIDRLFSVKGFGTVITGTVLSGRLHNTDTLYLLPEKESIKIKRLERHGLEVTEIQAGDRASINLTGLDNKEYKKGMLLSSMPYDSTNLIDVELNLFANSTDLPLWSQTLFVSGSAEASAKIHLLDKDKLKPGETAFAQIHLDRYIPVVYNDSFIIRKSSGDITLGGGRVIDAQPLHHRRRTEKMKGALKKLAEGDLRSTIKLTAEKHIFPISLKDISFKLALNYNEIKDIDFNDENDYQVNYKDNNDLYFWLQPQLTRYYNRVRRHIQSWHKNNPYDPNGKTFDELLALFEYPKDKKQVAVNWVINTLINDEIVEKRENTYAITNHKVVFTVETNKALQWIENFIKQSKMKTPLWSEMCQKSKYQGIDDKLLKHLLTYLVRRGKAYYIEESYIYYKIVDNCRVTLLQYLYEHKEGITVSTFRDLINGNRKICLLLFAIYDIEGIVRREEDYRFITEKGRRFLETV
ncbi:MAG TPA: selenocysteine-specific translation elongation factor [Candidatus Cloacimonadota bacterium]|nr:selenocysteine-specific translation elongation factor [Candidatus Cloacimonadales bacterium]HPY97153.1 selenocysteine-specific translation elongation factor [Candidatus Cloacimonadota bacterium]HQB41600.1 selenocysteine-specific translation elongation factor [Candidatus Cloacimonadota bacterium]